MDVRHGQDGWRKADGSQRTYRAEGGGIMAVNFVERIDDRVKVKHVLISVSDKRGLDGFVKRLIEVCPGVRVYSTGGTHKAIQEALGVETARRCLMQVAEYTGQPEMQGGLVKTLDFKIYLGLLSETYNDAHASDLNRVGAVPIDLVVVNLYPFAQTVSRPDATAEQARANIDIGGPCMVRASAKNFLRVGSVTDPADYDRIIKELKESGGGLSLKTRFELARKAFAHTAAYDAAISSYLAGRRFEQVSACYRTA
jgi:phosphoribosylaminoimidazolecarboxamide formyltransferase/IMP cyclohydrolase